MALTAHEQTTGRSPHTRWIWIALLAGMLVTALGPGMARGETIREFETWTDLATIVNLGNRWRYDGDYGIRGILTDQYWSLFFLRPSVRYRPLNWLSLHGGFGFFYNILKEEEDLPELRPWIGIRLTGPDFRGFVLSNYFRFEARAFYLKGKDDWDTVLRLRWQIQIRSPEYAVGELRTIYFLGAFEPFLELGHAADTNPISQYRFNAGVGTRGPHSSRVELHYIFHKVRIEDSTEDFVLDDHILRLRFFWAVN